MNCDEKGNPTHLRIYRKGENKVTFPKQAKPAGSDEYREGIIHAVMQGVEDTFNGSGKYPKLDKIQRVIR